MPVSDRGDGKRLGSNAAHELPRYRSAADYISTVSRSDAGAWSTSPRMVGKTTRQLSQATRHGTIRFPELRAERLRRSKAQIYGRRVHERLTVRRLARTSSDVKARMK